MSFIDRFFMIGPPAVLVSVGLFSLTMSWMTRPFFFILDSSGGRLLKTKTSGESNIFVVDPYLPDVKMPSLNSSRILYRWSVHSWFCDAHKFNMTIGSRSGMRRYGRKYLGGKKKEQTGSLRPHTPVAQGLIHLKRKASCTSSLRPHTLVA